MLGELDFYLSSDELDFLSHFRTHPERLVFGWSPKKRILSAKRPYNTKRLPALVCAEQHGSLRIV
jgi:hypothetical protein